jgi:hypothetical protein
MRGEAAEVILSPSHSDLSSGNEATVIAAAFLEYLAELF